MKLTISIFFLVFTLYCLQISKQKLFLAKIDTGKEELDDVQGHNLVRHNPQYPERSKERKTKKERKKERRRRKQAGKDYQDPEDYVGDTCDSDEVPTDGVLLLTNFNASWVRHSSHIQSTPPHHPPPHKKLFSPLWTC